MNSKGIFLIETLAACSIFFTVIFTFTPIIYQVKMEEHILEQRRLIQADLYNELQKQLSQSTSENQEERYINETIVSFYFSMDEGLWKGCATWVNTKNKEEEFCLYGYPDQ